MSARDPVAAAAGEPGAAVERRHATASFPFGLLSDPALPGLATALDPAAMAAILDAGCRERTSGEAPRVRSCAVEEVYYRAGRHCGVLYRLSLAPRPGSESEPPGERNTDDEWCYARLLPRDVLRDRYRTALAAALAARATSRLGLEAVSRWDEPGMLLWVFPNDPKLPGLRALADAARIGPRLFRARARFERVKYMPSKRCVLRYRVDADPPPWGSRAPAIAYVKAYPEGASAEVHRLQCAVAAALRESRSGVEVPEPLAHFEDESGIAFADWGGQGAIRQAERGGWPAVADRAARAIAALHLARVPGLTPSPSSQRIAEETREDAAAYAARVAPHRELVRWLLERFEAQRPDRALEVPRVPVHGAFRAEHVLAEGERTALLDLDGVTEGDPLIDAAEFVASLELLSLTGAHPGLDAARVSTRFLESYAACVPWPVERSRLGWYVLASVTSKMLLAVKRLARPVLERLEAAGPGLVARWAEAGGWAPAWRGGAADAAPPGGRRAGDAP